MKRKKIPCFINSAQKEKTVTFKRLMKCPWVPDIKDWLWVYNVLRAVQQVIQRHSLSGCFFPWFTTELLNNNSVKPLGRQHGVVERGLDTFLKELSPRPIVPAWASAHIAFLNLSFNICKMGLYSVLLCPKGKIVVRSKWDDPVKWPLHSFNQQILPKGPFCAGHSSKCWVKKNKV